MKISPGEFMNRSPTRLTTIVAGIGNISYVSAVQIFVDKVSLGFTGFIVPRIALGTDTRG